MSGLTLLETERLLLGGWREDQVDDLVRLHGDPAIAQYLTESGAPWSREQAEIAVKGWIEQFETQRMGKLRVVRKADGVLLGRAGFGTYPRTGEPEIGYALFQEHWGQGYATEAASALRDWIFDETEWDRFIGFADIRNHASLKVLRAIGMKETHVDDFHGLSCQFHVLRKGDRP